MPFTYEPAHLSGSTDGRNIKVAATASAGTTLHTATSSTTGFDELTLYATNTTTSAVKLTIEFGGTTSPDDLMEITIPPEEGWVLVVDRLRVQNSVVVRAFAGSANVINMNGRVTEIRSV